MILYILGYLLHNQQLQGQLHETQANSCVRVCQ